MSTIKKTSAKQINPAISKSIAASWGNAEVRERRSARNQVRVGRKTYKSLAAALADFGIIADVRRPRLALVADGKVKVEGKMFFLAE